MTLSSASRKQTFCRWRKSYGRLEPSEVCELKQSRAENAKLKPPVADLSLALTVSERAAKDALKRS